MQGRQLEQLLEESGHKLTPSRESVLALLVNRHGRVFTAAELLGELAVKCPDIGRATLFRTLDLLISLGALERVRLPGDREGYVLCGPPHHHHVVCTSCGAIGEVAGDRLDEVLAAAVRDSGFTLQSHNVELSGTCAPCRNS